MYRNCQSICVHIIWHNSGNHLWGGSYDATFRRSILLFIFSSQICCCLFQNTVASLIKTCRCMQTLRNNANLIRT